MILARITRAIREQNWFAVCLEFVIVIAGVVIGFQVTGWAGERDQRAIERRHLVEISDDLDIEIAAYDELIDSALYRIAGVDLLIREATGVTLPNRLVLSTTTFEMPNLPEIDDERRGHILGHVNLVRISVGNRSGYDSLINSGNINLLRSNELSRAIQVYYSNHDNLTDTQAIFREVRNEGVRLGYDLGLGGFDELPFEATVEVVSGSPAYQAYLRTARQWAVIHAALMGDQQAEAVALLVDIHTYLEDAP